MPLDLTDDKSTLVQVMAWCHQATSHYLSQCWPRPMSPFDVTRPEWVNSLQPSGAIWRHRTWSTLIQVMAWCLMAPSYHLNKCWLINHQWSLVAFTWGQVCRKCSRYLSLIWLKMTNLRLLPHIPGASELTLLPLDKMAAISQMTYSNAFSWI